VLLCAGAALTACSLEGATDGLSGGGSEPCFECNGEDGGVPAAPAIDGQTVAMLETLAPATSITEFLLRGTFPVPPHTYPRDDGKNPFVVLNWDGTPLTTQTEIVTRYANGTEGADVVEVLALVERDPAAAGGAPMRYEVVHAPHASPPGAGGADLTDFAATENLPPAVLAILSDPDALEISSYDCYGNRYSVKPLDGSGEMVIKRHGEVSTEIRIFQMMEPDVVVPGGTLPHFFGVHTYLSTVSGQEVLGLDLRFTNASTGRDTGTNLDDPLDKLYFREIQVSAPAQWSLLQDFPDPYFGGFSGDSETWDWNLVKPLTGGKLHVMRWMGQFHRRLWLTSAVDQGTAVNYAQEMGQAFCVRGTDPFTGDDLWSWWNKGTRRFFPQRYPLPALDHVGIGNIRGALFSEQQHLANHLLNGTSDGDYPVDASVMGWGHPYGVSYGGMTSGEEIFCWDGMRAAACGSYYGYRLYTALHRMHTDRMPNALYDLDGEPTSVERWLVENGSRDYVPFYHFIVPFLSSSYPDPFGFRNAPKFQINYVAANGLAAPYEGGHMSFDPHDYQHFIRYTRAPKVLLWLGNDSIAKDDLLMQAENFHLSFHANCNDSSGGVHTSGLRSLKGLVAANPGKGSPFGRGEAWGVDCAVAAFASASPTWRAAKRPWFVDIIETLAPSQGECTGFLQAFVSSKAVGGRYRARQQIEQSITENALMGLRETVFRGYDETHSAQTRRVLVGSLYAFISPMAFQADAGPWRYTGIGPLDVTRPIWCAASDMPNDAVTAGDFETYQDWSSFAYGFEITADPIFLEKALEQVSFASDLYSYLASQGVDNIENRAALIALLQHENGML
jgi:hypothetical protein